MKPWLFLLFLVIVSDMIAGAIAAYSLWRYRNGSKITVYLAALMGGIFAEGMLMLAANAFGHTATYTTGYAWCYWTGRGIHSATVWAFVLYLLGNRGREH